MSDARELAKRLREFRASPKDFPWGARPLMNRAADLLEAQAAENERLRDELDREDRNCDVNAAQAYKDVFSLTKQLGELRAENERLKSRLLRCIFCDFSGTLDELKAHSAECAQHPLAARIAELEREIERLKSEKT